MLNHLHRCQQKSQNVFENAVLMSLRHFCTGVLLFSLKYRFGDGRSLFVFTMALMSSDVIRL